MAVLVTGGAGYIGSIAVEQLLAAGERVIVLDNLSRGHRAAVAPGAQLIVGDILDYGVLDRVFGKDTIDTVMHFAAFIEVGESYQDPGRFFENNVEGAHHVLRTMVKAGVCRFILSSTAAVYGNPQSVPISEDMATQPVNPYGQSKLMTEQMLRWYDSAYGLRHVSLRYFNACGATSRHGEDHKPETHLVPNVLMAAAGRRPHVTVFGSDYPTPDGTCIRDYVHVADLCAAHLAAVDYLRADGSSEAINLGSSTGYSVLEVIESVKRVTHRGVPVIMALRRPGDPPRLVASADKARRILHWEPRRGDLDAIIHDAWAWYQAHPEGYND